jgi:hypothetical protein
MRRLIEKEILVARNAAAEELGRQAKSLRETGEAATAKW